MRVRGDVLLKEKRKEKEEKREGLLIKSILEPLYSHRDANDKCRKD